MNPARNFLTLPKISARKKKKRIAIRVSATKGNIIKETVCLNVLTRNPRKSNFGMKGGKNWVFFEPGAFWIFCRNTSFVVFGLDATTEDDFPAA
jgi:hypothetical protein